MEWSKLGARMLELVCPCCVTRVQLTFIDERRQLDAVMIVATMKGLRLISGNIAKHWEDLTVAVLVGNIWAPQAPNFETQMLLPIVWARPGSWGPCKDSSSLKGCVSAMTMPTPSWMCRIGVLSSTRRWKRRVISYRHADLTLRWPVTFLLKAETPCQLEEPISRRGTPDEPPLAHARGWRKYTVTSLSLTGPLLGKNTKCPSQMQQKLTGERRQVSTQMSQGGSGNYVFLFCCRRLPTVPSEDDSDSEGRVLHLLALDVNTWAPRVWNGASPKSSLISGGRIVTAASTRRTLRLSLPLTVCYRAGAHWRQVGIPPMRFMTWVRSLLRSFRLQMMMTTKPSVPIPELRAPLRT
ncbi:hypothetical protein MOQ_006513 [Trypanosoma cruzi marinkellei]|uniref:Uncharacterized protein n=1 Tax=Trypanosoma cruzi marinkellei TaxID=85056 RepID=K2MVH8_TRYCR|nr:hypothetical protein MOQ_006513 [Trypanosoma cruzi marinkellei]